MVAIRSQTQQRRREPCVPGVTPADRPKAIVLVDQSDWRAALAAAVLMASPIRAPRSCGDGTNLPGASAGALDGPSPAGSGAAGGAQVIRVGNVARPKGLKTTDLVGGDAAPLARAIDAFQAPPAAPRSETCSWSAPTGPSTPMPAAAWAAKSGDPILFATRDTLPRRRAWRSPPTSSRTSTSWGRRASSPEGHAGAAHAREPACAWATRTRRATRSRSPATPTAASAGASSTPATAWSSPPRRARSTRPPPRRCRPAAPTARCCSSTPSGRLPNALADYLLDIQPGYNKDPTRGVYNHGWIIGDDKAVSVATQSQIDGLPEIAPAKNRLPSQP